MSTLYKPYKFTSTKAKKAANASQTQAAESYQYVVEICEEGQAGQFFLVERQVSPCKGVPFSSFKRALNECSVPTPYRTPLEKADIVDVETPLDIYVLTAVNRSPASTSSAAFAAGIREIILKLSDDIKLIPLEMVKYITSFSGRYH